ncbi:chitobiase/beta-hexosaminidase C-terminal domain-containing protein [Prevotella communis]|uniref:chitobiase/beta-hexosaminidase C-terminal domain-containing protein n=1 Tax=Prevotella communis TaxID=2913614 RepID=UPI001EDA44EA|nr:chitobiase/beta-hexosaminidase C-terminal domain-containing protein [Prevotella communis]UKK56981.1 chitobiase/beta-hexosaminidase C-terminal domain-containing protein [Prevotella communis]
MKHFNLLKTTLLLCALIVGSLSSWADTTVSMTSFSAISGYVDDDTNISYAAAKGTASTAPAVNGNQIRVYQNGGLFTITANDGSKIKSVTLGSAMETSVSYSIDGGVESSNQDISASSTITINDLNCSSIQFTCKGTDKNHRLYVNSLSVTYSPASSIVKPSFSVEEGEVEKGTSLILSTTTEGADIYYTIDKTTPTSGSTKYTGTISINSAVTIKAIAVKGSESSVVATASYTIKKVETPTFSVAEGVILEGSTVELVSETDGATIHYTTDGSNPTASSATYSSPITINADVTIKAIAVKDNWDDSEVASVTYNVLTPIHGLSIDFESNDVSRYADWDFVNIVSVKTITAHGGTYYGNTDGKSTASVTTKEKVMHPYTFTCYISKESGNTTACDWKIQVSEDGSAWTDVATKSASSMDKGVWEAFSADLTSYSNVYVRLSYGSNTAKRAVDDIVLTTCEPISISAAGWATYCSSNALDFTGVTALTAYTATKEGSAVKFNKVTGKVPANTGLLVKGETANVPVCASAEAVTNLLVGVTAETTKDAGTIFVLMKGSKGIGFYKNTNDFTLRANSAYLRAEDVEGSTARAFIALDDETTGIADVKAVKEDAEGMFDLQGRKIAKPTKGLYIVNGKKVVVK